MRKAPVDLKIFKELFFEIPIYLFFDRTQLSSVGVSLLCDYPMVVVYILEINLTKRKKI